MALRLAGGAPTPACGLTASHFSKLGSVVGVSFAVAFQRPVYADDAVVLEWIVERITPKPSGHGWT